MAFSSQGRLYQALNSMSHWQIARTQYLMVSEGCFLRTEAICAQELSVVRSCHPNFPGPCSRSLLPLLPFLVSSNPDVSSERGQIGGWLPRLDTCPSIVQVQHRAGSWLGSRSLLSWWSPHYHFQDILSALGQREEADGPLYFLRILYFFVWIFFYLLPFPGYSLWRRKAADGSGQAVLSQAQVGHAGWVHQRRQHWRRGTNISGIVCIFHSPRSQI